MMGKKSRMKRAVAALYHGEGLPVQADNSRFVIGMAAPTLEQLMHQHSKDCALDNHLEHMNNRTRVNNNLPLGHPANKWKMERTFAPIEHWIETWTKTGEYEVLSDDTAVLRPGTDQEYYPVADAFHGMCETFELLAEDQGITCQVDGLRALADKIEKCEECGWADVEAAQATLAWMREVTRPVTPEVFSGYVHIIHARAIVAEQGLSNDCLADKTI